MERKTRVYISGSITKDKGHYQKFLNAEHKLKEAGCEVVNPARIGRLLPKSFSHGEFLKVDYAILGLCDAIYMLKGWNTSIGSKNELSFAKELGLKVIYEGPKNERIEV